MDKKLNKMKKWLLLIGVLTMSIMLLTACGELSSDSAYTVRYEGKEYVALEFPANIFYYDYNGNSHDNFDEVDGRYPIDSPKWDMIWNGGDLYCIKSSVDEAEGYYADDKNYVWYVLIDSDEEDNEINSYPITVDAAELEGIYNIESRDRDLAVFFDQFEKHGSVFKISEDGVVRGSISVAKYNGIWYWKSEVIDESQECDGTWPEYIQPLPASLSEKIAEAE
jgi:hypothetical protein